MHASGTFIVKINPADASPLAQEAGLGRMIMDKTFAGDMEGTSKGEMLTGAADSTGAMAYVALERVTAKLAGRSGSFLLMHNASMLKTDPGAGVMQLTVVPHSGTDELAGSPARWLSTSRMANTILISSINCKKSSDSSAACLEYRRNRR